MLICIVVTISSIAHCHDSAKSSNLMSHHCHAIVISLSCLSLHVGILVALFFSSLNIDMNLRPTVYDGSHV